MTQGEELLILWAANYVWCRHKVALLRHIARHGSFGGEELVAAESAALAQRNALYCHFGLPRPPQPLEPFAPLMVFEYPL